MRSRFGGVLLVACVALVACDSPAEVSAPAVSPPPASAVPSVAAPTPSVAPPKPRISKAGLNHFFAVALGAEYGDKTTVVTMWNRPEVTVRVHGRAGSSSSCLTKVISDFNALTEITDLKLTKSAADIELYIAPQSKFRSIDAGYVAGNDGFVAVRWSGTYAHTSANVMVRSSGISDRVRCHLIREELTQGMGMLRDSNRYANSIFYGKYYPAVTKYSALDKEVIRLLYSGAILPGATRQTVQNAVIVK